MDTADYYIPPVKMGVGVGKIIELSINDPLSGLGYVAGRMTIKEGENRDSIMIFLGKCVDGLDIRSTGGEQTVVCAVMEA